MRSGERYSVLISAVIAAQALQTTCFVHNILPEQGLRCRGQSQRSRCAPWVVKTTAKWHILSRSATYLRGGKGSSASTGSGSQATVPDKIDLDIEAQIEAERIMHQLESNGGGRQELGTVDIKKYQPSTNSDDPIVRALTKVIGCTTVTGWELLDSRWNGNEALRWTTDRGYFFVKMNRVEDAGVFMTEAISLSALAQVKNVEVPKPLHIGKLPKVGDIGPGAFMILEYIPLVPFGPMRKGMQKKLGTTLAKLHTSGKHKDLHKGRFGFPVSNFLALTPLNNEWCDTWSEFFRRRLTDQIQGLVKDKAYGRAALPSGEESTERLLKRLGEVVDAVDREMGDITITPSLLHGDLWIGNAGATEDGPYMFDPASFFGHSEFELAIMDMFGGWQEDFWTAYHAKIPKAPGFERRQRLYKLYHYLNQLTLFGDPNVRKTVERLVDQILDQSNASSV